MVKKIFALVLLLALAVGAYLVAQTLLKRSAAPPNVMVLMLDTLRADHLGAYGYARETSPAMDALAARGLLYETAYSVSNWTNPTIKTLFTGLPPQSVMRPAKHREAIKLPLPEQLQTFAELAQAAGYRTHALVDHPGINPALQFDQGFDDFVRLFVDGTKSGKGWDKSNTDSVFRQFAAILDGSDQRPLLAYVHLVYPHMPYKRMPQSYRRMFGDDDYEKTEPRWRQQIINAYDAQIRRTDDLIARMVAELDARELLDDTWIIITSDHGEAFWEHGTFEHGRTFYDEEIRVPMVVVPPLGQLASGQRIQTPVSNLDLFATIMDIIGQAAPEGTQGLSLARGLDNPALDDPRTLFSESPHSQDIMGRAVISSGRKLHLYPSQPQDQRLMLFDLATDPSEQLNLARQEKARRDELLTLLRAHVDATETDRAWLQQTEITPDDETLQSLKSLGYIQ